MSAIRQFLAKLLSSRAGAFGLSAVTFFIFVSIFAPLISIHDPNIIDAAHRLQGPSLDHILGTDHLGRDLYSRVIFGTRVAMSVAFMIIAISLTIGVIVGILAAFAPRLIGQAFVTVFDITSSFPTIILALALVAVLGPGLRNVVILVTIVFIPHFARVARAQSLIVRNSTYLEAEQVLGASLWRIVFRHVVPNIVGPIFVLASMDIPVVITIEAGLSFLGVGIRPPLASWGGLLHDGYTYLSQSPWPVLTSGLALVFATLGFTLFGESLRDAVDPRLGKPQ